MAPHPGAALPRVRQSWEVAATAAARPVSSAALESLRRGSGIPDRPGTYGRPTGFPSRGADLGGPGRFMV